MKIFCEDTPETLPPSPQTPTMDWIHGLQYPTDWFTAYPYVSHFTDHPKNRIELLMNKDFNYGLSNIDL